MSYLRQLTFTPNNGVAAFVYSTGGAATLEDMQEVAEGDFIFFLNYLNQSTQNKKSFYGFFISRNTECQHKARILWEVLERQLPKGRGSVGKHLGQTLSFFKEPKKPHCICLLGLNCCNKMDHKPVFLMTLSQCPQQVP